MSPIKTACYRIGPVVLAFVLAGCGDKSSGSTFSADGGGAYIAGWMPGGHKAATADISACAGCHGSNFSVGISRVTCLRFCHRGDRHNAYPLAWGYLAYAEHSSHVTLNGVGSCTNVECHGKSLTGVRARGAFCSACHSAGPMQAHPSSFAEWINAAGQGSHGIYVKGNGIASCATAVCHGTDLQGGTPGGPSCEVCHARY